jgi:multidrug efflux pump subunit AcrA (membrane-fusion protein)
VRFRGQALRQLEAPEQLDEVTRLATVPGWLATAALTVTVAAAGIWAVAGTVTRTVAAPGVLTHTTGISQLDVTEAGQVTHVWAQPNQRVTKGTPLYSLQGRSGAITLVTSPWDAFVVSWLISDGQLVGPGTRAAGMERLDAPGDALIAKVFVPAALAPRLAPGVAVDLRTASAPAAVFGSLHGVVAGVGAFPETEASLHAFLGPDFPVDPLLAGGNVIAVTVRLDADPAAPSGLRWTKAGPPFRLASLSQVSASFTAEREHPIRWLVNR